MFATDSFDVLVAPAFKIYLSGSDIAHLPHPVKLMRFTERSGAEFAATVDVVRDVSIGLLKIRFGYRY